eukprot:TRINITY_DN96120_c0_g1_i1.p1 TRINITY_DN96120_c0_g1~~TRINITY_DN96120_c0_g1_i1.p1  ORF type:complete len:287 (-),score=59.02 TRINITY_DN96120_c0_g1_i1:30-890(-)
MKRGRPKLSFDDSSGSSDDEEAGDAKLKKQKPASASLRGGLSQAPQSQQAAAETVPVPEAQTLAQVAALRAALGLGRRKASAESESQEAGGEPESALVPSLSLPASAQRVQLPASMRDIETFSEFLRLSPAIQDAAMKFSADELTALCETAARLKFFDGELFEGVFVHLRCRIRWGQFDIHQVTSVCAALVDLNATDPEVFRDVTQWLLPRVGTMSKAMRLQWLKLMAAVGHRHDEDEDFEIALRTTPLPGGIDVSASDDFMVCWDFVRTGGCPRGADCRWKHPAR